MFFLYFTLVTLVYFAIFVGLTYLVTERIGVELIDVLLNEDTWFWYFLGAATITFIIATFNWGPAILLPENTPNPETRKGISDFAERLWLGKNATPNELSDEPLPWATGTWFWWKVLRLYMVIIPLYAIFAFWDEVTTAFQARKAYIKRREEAIRNGHNPPRPPTDHRHGFGPRLLVEFVAEILAEFVINFATRGSR